MSKRLNRYGREYLLSLFHRWPCECYHCYWRGSAHHWNRRGIFFFPSMKHNGRARNEAAS